MDPRWAAENHLGRILAVTGCIHLLALISLGLRLYARIRVLRTPGRDDVVVVIATFLALGGWICFVLQGRYGLGRYSKVLSKDDLIAFEKISFFQSIISSIAALGLLKISIALFLLRLSKNKWYSRSLWAMIGFVIFYSVGAWLTFFLRCQPMAAFWDKRLGGSCYSMQLFKSFAMANSGFNIGTDVLSATLPISIIWSLQMSHRTRAYLIGVMSLGYLAVAVGIVKTVYQISLVTNQDRTFESSVQFWGFIQLNVGIIASSIPTLKPLLNKTIRSTGDDRRNNLNEGERLANATIGSGMKTPKSRKAFLSSLYTDAIESSHGMICNTTSHNGKSHVYSAQEYRFGSEDRILGYGADISKHIKCTTEVVVDSGKR